MSYSEKLRVHNERVIDVCKQVKDFYLKNKQARIYHGSTNSTRRFDLKKDEVIDVSNLDKIIEINTNERYALVEPNIPMDRLVEECLKNNFLPQVVMEFPGITVGGAIQGGAGESSSFKFGLFHNICTEYEIVLGNGDTVIASHDKNKDLFYGTAGSYGTLGIITLAKIKLIPAKKFVELSYTRTSNFTNTVEKINDSRKSNTTFIDGLLFSKSSGVVMTGELTDDQKHSTVTFSKASDTWFYLHVKNIAARYQEWTETIPIKDYLFRYDRGAFWMGQHSFNIMRVPFNSLTRYIFNRFLNTRTLYRSLHAAGFAQNYFIQDFCLPQNTTEEFFKKCNQELEIYPIWLCPLLPEINAKLSFNYLKSDLLINIGIYGIPKYKSDIITLNKRFETLTNKLGGRKWLYAQTYYTDSEFWGIYDSIWYSEIRKKYHAEKVFPDIYEKVYVKERIKGSIVKGFLNTIRSPFRLRAR